MHRLNSSFWTGKKNHAVPMTRTWNGGPRQNIGSSGELVFARALRRSVASSIKAAATRLLLLLFLGKAARGGGDVLGLRFRRLGCARFGRGLLGLGFRVYLIRCSGDCKGFLRQS
uniref:Uncharacterized protein n=1 Tax=Salix viminalis TaxID=40686 RepID=A0A6N2KHH4_SALVM